LVGTLLHRLEGRVVNARASCVRGLGFESAQPDLTRIANGSPLLQLLPSSCIA